MEEFSDDALNLILDQATYDGVKSLCQTDKKFRKACQSRHWYLQLDRLVNEDQYYYYQVLSQKPENVSMALYYKWLDMWVQSHSTNQAYARGLLSVVQVFYARGYQPTSQDADITLLGNHIEVLIWLSGLDVKPSVTGIRLAVEREMIDVLELYDVEIIRDSIRRGDETSTTFFKYDERMYIL